MKAFGMSCDQSRGKRIRLPPIAATAAISARCCSGVMVKRESWVDQFGVTIVPRSWRELTWLGGCGWRCLAEAPDGTTDTAMQSTSVAEARPRIQDKPVPSLQHWA